MATTFLCQYIKRQWKVLGVWDEASFGLNKNRLQILRKKLTVSGRYGCLERWRLQNSETYYNTRLFKQKRCLFVAVIKMEGESIIADSFPVWVTKNWKRTDLLYFTNKQQGVSIFSGGVCNNDMRPHPKFTSTGKYMN